MGLIELFSGKRVFIDTAPIIYLIEDHPTYCKIMIEIMQAVDIGKTSLFTSTLSLMEVLVQPLRLNRLDLADKYREILSTSNSITMLDMNVDIASEAAAIRSKYNFKTPDSIQLASAINCFSDYFLTNDKQLKHDELSVITIDSLLSDF